MAASNAKLNIKIIYGCGKTSTINCKSRKESDSEYMRLSSGSSIWDGHKYTSDFTIEKTK